MNKKVDSKKLFRILVVAMIAVIIILGGTYAWIRIGLSASNTNIIKAGALDLVVDESPTDGAEVRLERAIPQSYRQGITNKPYRFTLKNNSTIATDYTISLEDFYEGADASLTANDKIADNLIRYILVKNDDELVATNSKLLSTGRTIDTGTIAGKTGSDATAIPYTLYIWIDSMAGEDGTESDIMNKVFSARLGITAEQHHQTNNNGGNEETTTPVQTAFNPIYFAYDASGESEGLYMAQDYESDYSVTLSTDSPTTAPTNYRHVFLGMDAEGNKGVCMYTNLGLSCFQTNNYDVERQHIIDNADRYGEDEDYGEFWGIFEDDYMYEGETQHDHEGVSIYKSGEVSIMGHGREWNCWLEADGTGGCGY